jgi:hypothetical protein
MQKAGQSYNVNEYNKLKLIVCGGKRWLSVEDGCL